MDLELIEKLDNFNIDANIGLSVTERIPLENGEFIYGSIVDDYYWNAFTRFQVNDKEEFYNIWEKAKLLMLEKNRQPAIFVLPIMNIYNSDYMEEKFKLVSTEEWMIYNKFENIETLKTNCKLDIKIEQTTDMELYGEINAKGFSTGDPDDPYGELADCYKEAYKSYNGSNKNFSQEFYFIKLRNEIVGVVAITYNAEIMGIYGLAILQEYRKQNIGKEVLKRLLILCREKKLKLAFLQTEYGFYPAELYRNIGFETICIGKVYIEK